MKYQRVTTPANANGGDGYVGAGQDESNIEERDNYVCDDDVDLQMWP